MRYTRWALVVLATLTIGQAPPNDNIYILVDGSPCRPQGDDPKPSFIALDLQKNRASSPNAADIDHEVTLGAILAPGTDIDRFDATRGATIEGIVVRVKQGSRETCNCHASDPIDQDTHIELALSGSATPTQRVVVEVTPRIRKQMKNAGQDWSTRALQGEDGADGIVGKWLRITGWLFFDDIHLKIAENTNPGGSHNVRATCWEIHPVTALEVLSGPPPSAHELHPEVLAQLQRAQVKTLAQSPALREEIARRNGSLLKKYGDEAVREAEEEANTPPRPEETRKARSLRN
jgi:hypothetical protein